MCLEGANLNPTILHAAAAIGSVVAAGVLGSFATRPNIPTWYAQIEKPWFTPPNWLFGPAWTVLYIMLAYAFFRVLELPRETPGRSLAIVLFLVQITLNGAWSFAFFGARSPLFGLVVIAVFWIALAATMVAFWRLDPIAGWLLLPNLAWVSFAAALNAAIYRLN